jgi:protein-L-isoaspartate O-methyltransferase
MANRVYGQNYLTSLISPPEHMSCMSVPALAIIYTAILAEIIGPRDRVTAIEIDPHLAGRARDNLVPWPQATVIVGDGFIFRAEQPANAIVINAGVSHIAMSWLDTLSADAGRLLVPLTNGDGIERHAAERGVIRLNMSVQPVIHCVGGRDAAAEERLNAAMAHSGMANIRSLRRAIGTGTRGVPVIARRPRHPFESHIGGSQPKLTQTILS